MPHPTSSKKKLYGLFLILAITITVLLFLYIVNYRSSFSSFTGIPYNVLPFLQFACLGFVGLFLFLFILNLKKYARPSRIPTSDLLDDLYEVHKEDSSILLLYGKRLFVTSLGLGTLGGAIIKTTTPSGFEKMIGLPSGFAESLVLGGLVVAGILFVISAILFIKYKLSNR
jgi:hypothetical protein